MAASLSTPLPLLFLGATGYIGGAALDALLKSDVAPQLKVTTVSRGEDKAKILRERYPTITVVVGNHSDTKLITELASQNDVVLNAADADDLGLAKAIIEGLKARRGQTHPALKKKKPLYIHTSGTSVLSDPKEESGDIPPTRTFSDLDPEAFWGLPPSAPHHKIDLAVLDAYKTEAIDTIIIIPPTIVGFGPGINPMSIQVPGLVKAALARGAAGVLGKGANHWSFVNILDLADAFVRLLRGGLDGKATVGRDGVYYCEAGEYVHSELAQKIATTLNKLAPDLVPTTEVKPFTKEEIDEYLFGAYAGMVFGGNSVSHAERLKQLGWKPTHGGVYDVLEDEAKELIKQKRDGKTAKGTVSLQVERQ
jgi:nucleoside-diphosphate-sugar epimerase